MPKPDYLTPGVMVPILVDRQVVMAKYLEWSDRKDIMICEYQGKRLWRSPRSTLGDKGEAIVSLNTTAGRAAMREEAHNGHNGSVALDQPLFQVSEPEPSRFDINMRFEFVEALVDMVAIGNAKSLIVCGDGGLGKSFTVLQQFARAGLTEIVDDEETGEKLPGDYIFVKGFSTAKTLYRTLHDNRSEDSIIVFDDCDSVLKDRTAVNLLKAALDSYSTRTISWLSELTNSGEDLPSRFEFKGKIIFISNLRLDELPQPIISRANYVDVSMGSKEKIERMRKIAFAPKVQELTPEEIEMRVMAYRKQIRRELTAEQKEEALKLIEKHADKVGDLNMRTYLKVAEIHMHAGKRWADIAEYVITAF